jgi:hypothetical protein
MISNSATATLAACGVKTRYLDGMSSRLINVRLDAERLRTAQTLREHGVALSDVVRKAIDERFLVRVMNSMK